MRRLNVYERPLLNAHVLRFSASFRFCFLVYCVAFVLGFGAVIGTGRVIIPDRQQLEIGAPATPDTSGIENRKFSDEVLGYVPAAAVMLHCKRSGWLVTWDPYNGLERPVYHQSVLSPSFLLTLPLAWMTSDPFKLVTAVTLIASFLAGFFALMFAREWGLSAWPSLFAAITVGLGPTLFYWATFPMVAPTYGWALATYWLIARFARRGDFVSWIFLIFSTYALLATGYPQLVVYHIYLGIGLTFYLAYRQTQMSSLRGCVTRFILPMLMAAIFGAALILPTLLDTYSAANESSRVHPAIAFFQVSLPDLSNLHAWYAQIALWAFPQLYGNPINPGFAGLYGGLSMAPAAIFFVWTPVFHRVWGWWLFVAVLLLLLVSDRAFSFAVAHLGMGLSRTNPLASALIPITMIAATQLDMFSRPLSETKGSHERRRRAYWMIATLFYMAAFSIATALYPVMPVKLPMIVGYIAVLAICALAAEKGWPSLVVMTAMVWLCLFDRQMLLTQPESGVALSSPLVQVLQSQTSDGSRYAVVDSDGIMPPNINAQLGIASIHSYDSLSSRSYQNFVHRLGSESSTYGRLNTRIDALHLNTVDFKLANIGVLITSHALTSVNISLIGNYAGDFVYAVKGRWGRFMRMKMADIAQNGMDVEVNAAGSVEPNAATLVRDQGDDIWIKLNQSLDYPTLLIVSQSFDKGWRAVATSATSTIPLRLLRVNGGVEGVLVPPHVQLIHLAFKPWARFACISDALLVLMLFGGITLWMRERITGNRSPKLPCA